ncbi:MAG: DUF503 domain-containing protein [Kiritimatiellae bacterium]|nr:DUF503 domain-containing protein [Kiritimatiellia bacterium]
MVIGLLEVKISIPEARSLKDKRSVLRGIKDRLVARMNVSVAEVGAQDYWQSAEMAMVTVAATRDVVERRLSELQQFLRSDPRYNLLTVDQHLM